MCCCMDVYYVMCFLMVGRTPRSTRTDTLFPYTTLFRSPVGANDGPIVVTIEYRVRPMNFGAFVAAMEDLGRIRRRNGAHRWTLHQDVDDRSEEHTSELQSLMRISYAVFCLKKKIKST